MTEAVTDDNGCVEEGGDAENHAHDKYDEEEDLLTVTADGAAHLVTDAVIVDDDIAAGDGGGRVHEHNEDEHWLL